MSGAWGGGVVLLLVLGGCAAVEEGPVCDAREIEVGGVCVAKRCGSERWRVPEDAAAVVFVDAAAARGGDGSRECPLRSMRAAFERVVDEPGDHVIAVAAGEYRESLYRTGDLASDGITIAGRCAELTRVEATEPEEPEWMGSWTFDQAGDESIVISGLTVWGSTVNAAIVVGNGAAELTDVVFEQNGGVSLVLDNYAEAALTRVLVRDPAVDGDGAPALGGVAVLGGADVSLQDCEIAGARGLGLQVYGVGASAAVSASRISGMRAPREAIPGVDDAAAVIVDRGAWVTLSETILEDNEGAGLVVSGVGSLLVMSGGVVRGQRPGPVGDGVGAMVSFGGLLQLQDGAALVENQGAGLLLLRGSAQLTQAEVSGNLPAPGALDADGRYTGEGGFGGFGVVTYDGTLTAADSRIVGNTGVGILLGAQTGETPPLVMLNGVEVSGTLPLTAEVPGYGLAVGSGQQVNVRDSWFRENAGAGVIVFGGEGAATGVSMAGGGVTDTRPGPDGERGYGVEVQNAEVSLTGVVIERNLVAGVLLSGPRTVAQFDGVQVREQRRGAFDLTYGVLVDDGARLQASGVEVRDGVGYGLVVRQVDLERQPSVAVVQGLTLGPPAPGGADIGLAMSGPTEVTVDALRVVGSQLAGVVVSEGTLTLRDARIEQVTRGPDVQHGVGIGVEDGGTLDATGLSVAGVEGAGLWVREGGVRCEGCTLAGTTLAGAVLSSGSLELVGGRVEAPRTVGEVSVGVLSTAVGAGQRSLWLTDTRVEGGAHSAVLLQRAGDYVITGGELLGGAGFRRSPRSEVWVHGNALAARDLGAAGVRVLGTTLRGGLVGLFLDHSSAALQGVQFVDVDRDLVQQDCGDTGLITLTGLPDGANAASCALGQVVPSEWFADVEFNVFLGVPELEDALPLGQQIPTPSRP